jgi:hypothetical protein
VRGLRRHRLQRGVISIWYPFAVIIIRWPKRVIYIWIPIRRRKTTNQRRRDGRTSATSALKRRGRCVWTSGDSIRTYQSIRYNSNSIISTSEHQAEALGRGHRGTTQQHHPVTRWRVQTSGESIRTSLSDIKQQYHSSEDIELIRPDIRRKHRTRHPATGNSVMQVKTKIRSNVRRKHSDVSFHSETTAATHAM